MKVQLIEESFDPKVWNEEAIHPLQAWEWGEARRKTGIEVLRLGEFEKNKLVNTYQITLHKLPYVNYKIGYLPRSKFPSVAVLDFLYDYSKKNNIIFIKIEPYEEKNSKFEIRNSKLKSSPHPLFPAWTIILDLAKSEDELLKQMKSKTRYNIRLAQKKGVTVSEMTNPEGFDIFVKLYFETTKRQHYFGHNLPYHKTIFETLRNQISHIFVAKHNNIPLAAYEIFIFKNIAHYVYGGSSEEFRNLMAPHLLMWESIQFSKKIGAKKFDFWGSLEPNYDGNHPWAGFTRFKEGFGGSFIQFLGSYDLIINPPFYAAFSILQKIRNAYLSLRGGIPSRS